MLMHMLLSPIRGSFLVIKENSRNLEKALELYAKLIAGENVSKVEGKNSRLYEEYSENPEVYEILNVMLKKLNLYAVVLKNF